jgi:hypothetical protein
VSVGRSMVGGCHPDIFGGCCNSVIDDDVAYFVVLMPCVSDGPCIGIYEVGY